MKLYVDTKYIKTKILKNTILDRKYGMHIHSEPENIGYRHLTNTVNTASVNQKVSNTKVEP